MLNPQPTTRIPHTLSLPGLRLELESASEMVVTSANIAAAVWEPGYNHVGLEERVADGGLDWGNALSVVERLCAPCSQANTLCFVQAAEAMSHLLVPPRAASLRLVLAEIERIVS